MSNRDIWTLPIKEQFAKAMVDEMWCPRCLGELDTGWECNNCDFDGLKLATGQREECEL